MAWSKEEKKKKAKVLLTHYFKLVWDKAGLTFDQDNIVEVEEIIDLIMGDDE